MKPLSGILLLDKPLGISSAGMVRAVENRLRWYKVGHLGTLDPMASGLLVVMVGHAVKMMPYLLHGMKSYTATIEFGKATDTYDREGTVVEEADVPTDLGERLVSSLAGMTGRQMQVPPIFSAIKKDGKRLYELARKGKSVVPEAREVVIHNLTLQSFDGCQAVVEVRCSAGTYIRSLAVDLGTACGTVAFLAGLRRTESTPFRLSGDALSLEDVDRAKNLEDRLLPLESFDLPGQRHTLAGDEHLMVLRGTPLPFPPGFPGGPADHVFLLAANGELMAVGQVSPDASVLQIKRVIRPDIEW